MVSICYQGQLEKLEEEFQQIEREQLQCPKVGMVCLALVLTVMEDGSSSEDLLRARIQEVTEKNVSVKCTIRSSAGILLCSWWKLSCFTNNIQL